MVAPARPRVISVLLEVEVSSEMGGVWTVRLSDLSPLPMRLTWMTAVDCGGRESEAEVWSVSSTPSTEPMDHFTAYLAPLTGSEVEEVEEVEVDQ